MTEAPVVADTRSAPASRLRVVIGHPRMGRGGSESLVMWLIEALKAKYEVTVATTGGWDLASLNAFYGTQVKQHEVKIRIAPVPRLIRGLSADAVRGFCFQSFARKIAGDYDIRISAYNLTDWGLPAVHFLADFSWNLKIRYRLDPETPGFFYRDSILRKAYLAIANAYGRPSGRDYKRDDLVIANSKWAAKLYSETCGVECNTVVYPSVWAQFPPVSWAAKEQAFAMIGRIAPEKQVERAIAILEAVRRRGHNIKLHLCGQIEDGPYGRHIEQLCGEHAEWIVREGRVAGSHKAHILSHCRFGIQTRAAEPFGISVAEMVKAGAIVFAPNDGGQTEILDHSDLLFCDMEDAAEKISAVLSNEERQVALRGHLARQAELFSSAKFMEEADRQIARAAAGSYRPHQPRRRPRVAIGHPNLAFGGSESTVMWLIEALKKDCDVTVITTGGWNLHALNAFYGTQVKTDEVKVRIAPVPLLARSFSAAALRGACYQRFARQVAGDYDMRISAYNATDWGMPAVHFIGDFSWKIVIRERLHPPTPGFIYRDTILRTAYLKIAAAFMSPSGRDFLRDDLLIANSAWTAETIQTSLGIQCRSVIYPPVWVEFPDVPWERKQLAFVMIGRIAPEKQVEKAISVLQAVRERGHAVRLYLCGEIGHDLYGRRIARLCEEHKDWVVAEGQVTGDRKIQILAQCRFGIQASGAEAFGISVAEMVKAGAIVFASANGGQAEILDRAVLTFDSTEQAVEHICSVLEDDRLQADIREHLQYQGRQFRIGSFMKASRGLLEPILWPAEANYAESLKESHV